MCPEARKPVFPHPSFLQAGAAGWSRGHDLDVEAGEPRLPEKTVITLKTVSSRSHGLTNTWGLRIDQRHLPVFSARHIFSCVWTRREFGRALVYRRVNRTEEVASGGGAPASRHQRVLAYSSSFWSFLQPPVLVCGFSMGENRQFGYRVYYYVSRSLG